MCGYALSLARRAKRIDTTCGGFYPLGTPVSTLGITRRRPETGDRSEIGERQRIFTSVSFSTCSQCQIPYCDTYRLLYAGATQGELPEGQEKVPWGITVSRNSLAWIFCTTPTNCTRYTVGCDKVNCPSGQEKVPWGTTRRTACIRPAQSIP